MQLPPTASTSRGRDRSARTAPRTPTPTPTACGSSPEDALPRPSEASSCRRGHCCWLRSRDDADLPCCGEINGWVKKQVTREGYHCIAVTTGRTLAWRQSTNIREPKQSLIGQCVLDNVCPYPWIISYPVSGSDISPGQHELETYTHRVATTSSNTQRGLAILQCIAMHGIESGMDWTASRSVLA